MCCSDIQSFKICGCGHRQLAFLWQRSSLKIDHGCAKLIYNCFLWLIYMCIPCTYKFTLHPKHLITAAHNLFFVFVDFSKNPSTWDEWTPHCWTHTTMSHFKWSNYYGSKYYWVSLLQRLPKHWGADQFKIKLIGSRLYCFYCDCCTIFLPTGKLDLGSLHHQRSVFPSTVWWKPETSWEQCFPRDTELWTKISCIIKWALVLLDSPSLWDLLGLFFVFVFLQFGGGSHTGYMGDHWISICECILWV